jgi:Fe-S cluster assembly protein SufD
MSALSSYTLPTTEEEVWRYSRIAELDLDGFAPVVESAEPPPDLFTGIDTLFDALGPRSGFVLTVDGRITRLEGEGLAPLADDDELAPPVDVFGELNAELHGDGVVVRVPRGAVVDHPIVIVQFVGTDGGAVFPYTLVDAGEASQVTVVEVLASPDVRALVAPVVDLRVGPAANVRYLNVQQFGGRVWQVVHQVSRVDRDATLHSSMVALGGEYARVRADSKLVGAGATSHLLAAYFGDGRQMHDFRTMQDHDAPKTTSDLLFKGAVEDTAESVYTGLIRVKKGAAGTRAFQTNRNLVLSEGAAANSVPNLEIEENDVSCSHASAVGPIDEDQRYYLEARGIPTEVAERLIVLGFFDDILERVPVPGLRVPLRAAVAAKLDGRSS